MRYTFGYSRSRRYTHTTAVFTLALLYEFSEKSGGMESLQTFLTFRK